MTPHECLEKECSAEWKACIDDSQCIPTIHDCEKKCGDRKACWELCLKNHDNKAANTVIKCGVDHNCFGGHQEKHLRKPMHKIETALAVFTPEECIKDHCADEAQACGKDQGCLRALQDCERECKQDQSCWTNCVPKKGNAAASAFWKCIVDNNCLNQVETAVATLEVDPQQCIEEKCPNEWASCQKDSKCVPTI